MSRSRTAVLALLAVSAIAGFAAPIDAATGLALLALATMPAIFAVPLRGRRALGVVVATFAVAAALLSDLSGDVAAWASAVALAAAGGLTAVRATSWSGLTRRYGQTDESSQRTEPVDLWLALDRGEDPTMGDSPSPADRDRHRDPGVGG